jgi:hypothetical protein
MNFWDNLRGNLLDPSVNNETDENLRAVSKWTLELTRNVVAVAGLQLFALLSENTVVRGVAFCAYTALYIYCISYFRWFVPYAFPIVKNRNARAFVILTVLVLIGGAGIVAIDLALRSAIDEIVPVQKPPPKLFLTPGIDE